MFPYVIQLSFIFTVILTAKAIVYEKETGLKEAFKLMGTNSFVYWFSWYIKTFVLLIPSLIFMVIGYKLKLPLQSGAYMAIIDKTDKYVFTILMFLYASSLNTFILMCSTFFKKSSNAGSGTGIIYCLTYLPHIFVSFNYVNMSFAVKFAAGLINNLAVCLGIQIIGLYEGKGLGSNFLNLFKAANVEDDFTLFHVFLILFLNNFIHLFFVYYFDNVFPGDHGIPKPWYFLFSNLIPKKKLNHNDFKQKNLKNNLDESTENYFEDEFVYSSKNIGIQIMNIEKEFEQLGKIKRAVNNVSMNIFENQITVLLGKVHICLN